VPAPGLDIEDGIQALQSKMAYNKKISIDGVNRPHLYVSNRCQNIIQAFQEYTAEGGPDEAWKDGIDVCRYAAIAGIYFVEENKYAVEKNKTGGY
jgi:hypothetical protein